MPSILISDEVVPILQYMAHGGDFRRDTDDHLQCGSCAAGEDDVLIGKDGEVIRSLIDIYHYHQAHRDGCLHILARHLYAQYLWKQRRYREMDKIDQE